MALVYDPRYQTFDSWAALMVEGYAAQQLEIPTEQTDWRAWAAGLKGIDIFSQDAVPSPYEFEHWDDWAAAVVNVVSVSTS